MKKHIQNNCRTGLAGAALAVVAALAAGPAAAIDVSPGDYSVLPSGTTLGLFYLQFGTSNTLDVEGVGEIPQSKLETVVGLLRGVHYTDLGGVPVSVQAILPIGNLSTFQVGGADTPVDDGLGDLTLGATVYPVHSNDPLGTTIGLTAFIAAPTGAYDVDKSSLGSGTWTFTPQIGIQQGLGNGFFVDTYADVAFRLDHTEGGRDISRDPSIEVQTYLRYQFDQKTSVSFGYAGLFGGKSEVNDTYTGLKTRSDQLRLFANTFVAPTIQVQGMVGTDVNAEGGFKQNFTTQLRLLKIF